jgi:hypothetical protein
MSPTDPVTWWSTTYASVKRRLAAQDIVHIVQDIAVDRSQLTSTSYSGTFSPASCIDLYWQRNSRRVLLGENKKREVFDDQQPPLLEDRFCWSPASRKSTSYFMHPSRRQMLELWCVVESMAGRLSALGQCISKGCRYVYTITVRAQDLNGIFELG